MKYEFINSRLDLKERLKDQLIFIFFFINFVGVMAQPITQTIRGEVTDKETRGTLIGAVVTVYKDSTLISGAVTDSIGSFRLREIPLGKYTIKTTHLGYETAITSGIIVNSAKEIVLNIEMEGLVTIVKEVSILASKKNATINEMASGSVRTFSIEETNRYAGSRSDPARMVSNFAGVQGADDSRNDIVIRGNSPMGVLWRLEGIDIPNPNHFAGLGTTGGSVSILNNKTLGNSDFMTSAFPAEYGNSTAGVFDLKMRNGNNEKHEFTGQLGFLGTELYAEGPLSKKTGSSYLFTYRYSTLKLFEALQIPIGTNAVPNYQDMSFKLNFPTKNGTNISIFSIGGISNINILVSTYTKPEDEIYGQQNRDQYFGSGMNVTGVSYIKSLNSSTYIKLVVAESIAESHDHDNLVYRNSTFQVDSIIPKIGNRFLQGKLSANLFINQKFSNRIIAQTGIQINRYSFNMLDSNYNQVTYQFDNRLNYKGCTYLIQPYTEWKFRANDHLIFYAGIHGQFLTFNGSSSIEPRVSVRWNFLPKQSLSFSAGMHSQMQPTYIYFYHLPSSSGEYVLHNKNLGFTHSAHYVLSYDYSISNSMRLKIETYYQHLYNIPIDPFSSSFSLINEGMGFDRSYHGSLVNKGIGENYGVEFTFEKFFNKSYFFTATFSLYNSKYQGSDEVERSTNFNGTYAMNMLAGKDFKIGERKSLGIGGKVTTAGGRRYTPLDVSASQAAKENIFIDSLRNTLRFKPYFRADVKISFKVNTSKLTHEFALDLVNIFGTKNILSITYSPYVHNQILENYQLGFLPLFYYKLDF